MYVKFCALATVLLCVSVPASAAVPAIYNLGTLGGTYSGGFGVNAAGQVAGQSNLTGDSASHAFRYDGTPGAGGAMRDLGTLRGTYSSGYAINDTGQVAGNSNIITDDTALHAFRYDGTLGSGGVMRDLGTLGGTYSFAYGLNESGAVAGTGQITGDTAFHAFRYDGIPGAGGIMRDLGTLGGTVSDGYDVNNAGVVTGESYLTGDTALHAFRYDGTPGSGGVMRDLGTLGGTNSFAYGVNDAGQIAGTSDFTGDTTPHAFRYDGTPGSGGVMRDLGTLGGMYSSGFALNDPGQVVGQSHTTDNAAVHAFLYTGIPGSGGQMIDLDIWLDANNPIEGANWLLIDARSISNNGWITGIGSYDPDGVGGIDAVNQAYLLDASALVPEPSTTVLLSFAMAAILGSLSQRSKSRRAGRRIDHRHAVRRPSFEPLEDRRFLSFSSTWPSQPEDANTHVVWAPSPPLVADFTSDGILDKISSNAHEVVVRPGRGDGTFGAPIRTSIQSTPGAPLLAVADFNGDNQPDVFTAAAIDFDSPPTVNVILGMGDGRFVPAETFSVGTVPTMIGTGKIFGTGRTDVAIAGYDYISGEQGILALFNDGVWWTPSLPSLPGDYNGNGKVDTADYVVWRKNNGTTNALPNDPTGGTIGTAQYNQWRAHFGQTDGSGSGTSANAAVPEPTTLVMLMFAVASWCLRRVRAAYKVPTTHQRVKQAINPVG